MDSGLYGSSRLVIRRSILMASRMVRRMSSAGHQAIWLLQVWRAPRSVAGEPQIAVVVWPAQTRLRLIMAASAEARLIRFSPLPGGRPLAEVRVTGFSSTEHMRRL